jgi:hypothetical protein
LIAQTLRKTVHLASIILFILIIYAIILVLLDIMETKPPKHANLVWQDVIHVQLQMYALNVYYHIIYIQLLMVAFHIALQIITLIQLHTRVKKFLFKDATQPSIKTTGLFVFNAI